MGRRRRRVLASIGGTTGLLAGCLGQRTHRVRILVAGSLQYAASHTLQQESAASLEIEAHGSVQAARLVASGKRDPDILALADPALFDRLLSTPWHAVIASNELVLAYNPDTTAGARVGDADRWFEPLRDDVSLGRTDPDLDPLGYRTLFALDLAEEYYDQPKLADDVLAPDQLYPETQLLAQFETGSIDAAFVYRNMAVERDYPFVRLPAAINLGDPTRADQYAAVSYELPDGTVTRGAPIEYAAVRRNDDDATAAVFETLLTAEWLTPHGFSRREQYPRMEGDVPNSIER